jgi:hypothetical protein
MKQTISKSFPYAAGAFAYVFLIALFFSNAERLFGAVKEPNFLIPVFMLLLFVISAAVTGLLVLGKPVHLYLSGHKKEAFVFLSAILGWLAVFLLIVGVALILC